MKKFAREDLLSLEDYSTMRDEFRARVMEHKKHRQLPIGPNATLYFEDALTMQYQVQEMLRIERIFEVEGIEEELDTYNELIPDGSNWKATFMIEYTDENERKVALEKMIDIEHSVWMKVNDLDAVRPIADEDLERTSAGKTSSVHFLRFELTTEMIEALKNKNAKLSAGIDHDAYHHEVSPVPDNIRESLAADLD